MLEVKKKYGRNEPISEEDNAKHEEIMRGIFKEAYHLNIDNDIYMY